MHMPEDMDYEEMSEPNMKLSRALLIVLVLHVVAVAGIIAFNSIKSREGALSPASDKVESVSETKTETASVATKTKTASAPETKSASTKVTNEEAKPAAKSSAKNLPADTGKIYTVVKGENPVTIARKLKVSETDLLLLNQIEDPRKLQIGQKLHIPAAKKSKGD